MKERLRIIIFEAETPAGKLFDVILLWAIALSVVVVMLDSVENVRTQYSSYLFFLEWFFTVLFSVEYLLRIWSSRRGEKYALSFFGIVDFVSCLPSYVAFLFVGSSAFGIIRILRLLRMFRILKMVNHVRGGQVIIQGLLRSRAKITVFFFTILILAFIAGTLLYFVESKVEGTDFTSIPMSIYYAIVSVTTVGYGDVTVQTDLGRFLTTLLILSGYAVMAVPTGIVTSEMVREQNDSSIACPSCGIHGHLSDATYCRKCGEKIS